MQDDIITEHESFGCVRLNRTAGKTRLFGSSVLHHNYMSLTIFRAEHVRSALHCDRYHPREEIIRISMSAVQLSELMFNVNVGEGVPCTLNRYILGGKYISAQEPPVTSKQTQYEDEFKEKLKKVYVNLEALALYSEALEDKPTINKTERRALTEKAKMALQELKENTPFILKMFNEQVEKVVKDAKGEIEAYHSRVVNELGMKAIADHGKLLPNALPEPQN